MSGMPLLLAYQPIPCCRLETLASTKRLNLRHLDVEAFANHLLPEKLPSFKIPEIAWQSSALVAEPSEEWLRLLWTKLEVGIDHSACPSCMLVYAERHADFRPGWQRS